ncbi:MAG: type 4a pilus biogenesis protein PilO, partial [Syntrophobacteraceae bacterium]
LGGGFYGLKFKTLMEASNKLHGEVRDSEKRLADLKQKEKQIDGVKAEVARAREELSYYLAFLPDQKEIPGLLESVSRIGSEVGLENILFQPQGEQQNDFYATVPVRLDLVGTYSQLGVFLDKISKLDRILKVEDLSLTRQPANSTVRVSCTMYTYRFSEQAQKPAADKGKGKKK